MILAGIDYSMSSPAVTVYDDSKPFKFENFKMFAYPKVKKYAGVYGPNQNVTIDSQPTFTHPMERFHNLMMWVMGILKQYAVEKVCMEGYAMGAKGNVFNIGENGGILQHALWLSKIPVELPAPTEVKKYFFGKGNAIKLQMAQAFQARYGIDMMELIGIDYNKTAKNPDIKVASDLVDSVAMLAFMLKQ